MGLCLQEQVNEILGRQFRKVSETKEAISWLKQAEKMFISVIDQERTLYNNF